jgi:hypothetical protein
MAKPERIQKAVVQKREREGHILETQLWRWRPQRPTLLICAVLIAATVAVFWQFPDNDPNLAEPANRVTFTCSDQSCILGIKRNMTLQYNFEWDPYKAKQNLRKHKVSFERAAEVFLDPLAMSIYDEQFG